MFQVPQNNEDWKEIELGFRTRWNFPGCHGAIDGKHLIIQAPPNCGSEYFNYKGSNSVVLMAVVDHDYCFRHVNIGANGRNSDGGIFKNSKLRSDLENNLLPKGGFLVGDDAFPLKSYLLKPYSGTNLSTKQKIFNYRVSRARRIVENAFGILASRFRICQNPYQLMTKPPIKLFAPHVRCTIGYVSQVPAITFQGVVLMKKI